jgi:hypothetical protein
MLKNITFSADEELIRKARKRANAEQTTLNEEFRRWLEKYAERLYTVEDFTDLMDQFKYVKPGRKFRRDELNER